MPRTVTRSDVARRGVPRTVAVVTSDDGDTPLAVTIPLASLPAADRRRLVAGLDFNPRHAVGQMLDAALDAA